MIADKVTQIGERIRRTRVLLDHTQQSVADQLGITASAYAKIERGETDPSVSRLYQLAEIFEVDIVSFFGDELSVTKPKAESSNEVTRKDFDELTRMVVTITRNIDKLIKPEAEESARKGTARVKAKK